MKKLDSILLKTFLYELPIILLFLISIFALDLELLAEKNNYAKLWYDLGGCYIFGSWMLFSIYLSIRLLISAEFRQTVLSKITFMRERDEREVVLTGQAARTTMLTTLAILIFLFCLSCFQISFYRVPPELAADGKSRVMSWGIGFSLLADSAQSVSQENSQKEEVVSYTGLPISSSAIILGLIGWQIISYNFSMRRNE